MSRAHRSARAQGAATATGHAPKVSVLKVVATPPDRSSALLLSSVAGSGWKDDTELGAVKEEVNSRSSPGASTCTKRLMWSETMVCDGSPGLTPTSRLLLSVFTTSSTAPKVATGSVESGVRDAATSEDRLAATACPVRLLTDEPAEATLVSSVSAAVAPPALICEALATSDTTDLLTWSSSSGVDALSVVPFARADSSVSRTAAAAVALLFSRLLGLFSELAMALAR